jgi:hypothetical protein
VRIVYYCRHCQNKIGELDGHRVEDARLGLRDLTPEETSDLISYNSIENATYVKTICEHCQEAIEAHPELSLLSNPLQ